MGIMAFAIQNLYGQKLFIYDQNTLLPINQARIKECRNESIDSYFQTGVDGTVVVTENSTCFIINAEGYLSRSINRKDFVISGGKFALFPNAHSVEEVVVSASKFREKRKDVAQKIQVISKQELILQSQSTTADVLANSGSVFMQKSQLGGGSPIIRGFETNKVLLVVDGVRLNNAIYRGGHLQNILTVDNAIMERVEVVFGPGSVVYGSDAIGGVMHFTTKNPVLSSSDTILVKSGSYLRYFSAAQGFSTHADVSLGTKRFGSLSSFTYSSFGDLRQGSHRNPSVGNFGSRNWYVSRINGVDSIMNNADSNLQIGSGYSQYDVLQKFTFLAKSDIVHKLNFQLSNSSPINRYDRLVEEDEFGLPVYAEWYYGPQFRFLGSYAIDFNNDTKLYDAARFVIAYQSIEESRMDRKFSKDILNHRIEKIDVFTLNVDMMKKVGLHEMRFGIDGFYNFVNSSAFTENILNYSQGNLDTRYPDGGSQMYSLGCYGTHTWELSKKLILNDGLRVSYVGLYSKFNDATFFPFPFDEIRQQHLAVNGNIGLIYMPSKPWRMSINGSSGFRAPNVDDLTKVFKSVPGKLVVPNPNLKAEYSFNGEYGIERKLSDGLKVQFCAYYTFLKNALMVQKGQFMGQDSILYEGQMSQVMTTTNAGKAYVCGLEAMLSGKINDRLSIFGTINYTKGRNIIDSVPLDHIPPLFGKLSLVYSKGKFRSEFFTNYSGWKHLDDYSMSGEDNFQFATSLGMPSWYTLNVRLNYNFTSSISIQGSCENILDKNYRNFASNISAPGRNFLLTIRGAF